MREDLLPHADLLQPPAAPELPRRPRLHERVVVVEVARPPLLLRLAGRLLIVEIRHPELAEGAVVEPVVAHPAVDHRVHRHGHLERRVRIHERHQRQESVVRDAEDADLAVRFRDVLHEPVDRVVRVRRVVHRRRVLRPVHGAVHHVVALGAVLAAHVLHDADVAALDDRLDGVVVAVERRAEVRALVDPRELVGVVGRPREEDRRRLRAQGRLRHEDDRVQLHAVAHRDHHLAPHVVEAVVRRHEARRHLARQRRVHGGGRRRRRSGLRGRRVCAVEGPARSNAPASAASTDRVRTRCISFTGETSRATCYLRWERRI